MTTKTIEPTNGEAGLANLTALASARDRVNIEKYLTACDAEANPGHAQTVRKLLSTLFELAPLPVRTSGGYVVQFFVADGKYRMQVFALEDSFDGNIVVYLPDVLAEAVTKKVLGKNGQNYFSPTQREKVLMIELLDSSKPLNPPEHVKHMTGWNRKAIRLSVDAADPQSALLETAERLCALAAVKWKKK